MEDKNKPNLYWPVYKNLEREVLELADAIHISDSDIEIEHVCDGTCDDNTTNKIIKVIIIQPQMKVHSIRISDLLFRICAEIESLIKDLYREEMKCEPKKIGPALIKLNELWLLDKKVINVVAPTFYFQKNENKTFAPFNYTSGDDNDYYTAYNCLKHDRVKNIRKATVHFLVRAMAALYILNIYHRNQEFWVKNDREIWELDKSFGSMLFSVLINQHYKEDTQINKRQRDDNDNTRYIYLAVYNEKQIENINENIHQYNRQALIQAQSILPELFEESQIEELANNLNIMRLGEYVGEIVIKREIEKLSSDDRNAVAEFIKSTEYYKEFSKNNSHIIDTENTEIATLINHASTGYYYKKFMNLASAAGSFTFSTSSHIILNKLL
jgi:hypothetical protein